MKKVLLITLVVFAAASFAVAQIGQSPSTDVLGAHLNYGHGFAGRPSLRGAASGSDLESLKH